MSRTLSPDDRDDVEDLLETIEAEGWAVENYFVMGQSGDVEVQMDVNRD
jgi:hypothetical protein